MEKSKEQKIGQWSLRIDTDEIVCDDGRRKLDHKVMKLLVFLLNNPSRDLSKDEILQAVWGEGVHTEEVLTVAVSNLRKALDDDFHRPKFIKTIPRYGYRMLPSSNTEIENNTTSQPRSTSFLEVLHERVGLRFLIITGLIFTVLILVIVILLKVDIR